MRWSRLVLIAVAGLAWGAAVGWLALAHGRDVGVAGPVLDIVIGWAFTASGLVLMRVRPGNAIGALLTAVGFLWLTQLLRVTDSSPLVTLAWTVSALPLAGLVALALAFPGGRLASRPERWIAAGAVALAGVVQVGWLLFLPEFPTCDGCRPRPANALLAHRSAGAASGIEAVQNVAGAALGVITVVILVRRWRRGSPALRRHAAPMLAVGAALCTVGAVALANEVGGRPLDNGPWWALSLVFALVPVAVAWVLVRGRLRRAEVASLVVELGAEHSTVGLPGALARTLGDPRLKVLYWLEEGRRYVDADGRPAQLPVDGGLSVTHVERAGRRVASLVHDPVLDGDPDLIASVCAAAAFALENERLQVELRARAQEVEASRSRLVEVGDRERRRLERDLHDGAQQRLISVAMSLGLARARERTGGEVGPLLGDAQRQLEEALRELRELSHGLLPPILRERGLAAALRDLAKRAPVRAEVRIEAVPPLAPAAEAALFFTASEALTNAAKHARASRVELTLSGDSDGVRVRVADDGVGGADPAGSGLQGLADRLGALSGTLSVRSAQREGTIVEGWAPCDSYSPTTPS